MIKIFVWKSLVWNLILFNETLLATFSDQSKLVFVKLVWIQVDYVTWLLSAVSPMRRVDVVVEGDWLVAADQIDDLDDLERDVVWSIPLRWQSTPKLSSIFRKYSSSLNTEQLSYSLSFDANWNWFDF